MFHPNYHPVILLPENYEVYDFSQGYDSNRELKFAYGIGKYNEHRPGMYKGEHFEAQQRTVHMGIDIAAPIGCQVFAFAEGTIFKQGYNSLPWDYGTTIITKHNIDGHPLFALHGHLSRASLDLREEGDSFSKGDLLATIGNKNENGGWNPHLHFQLSIKEPTKPDMPGVVSLRERAAALKIYPDPQLVLGQLY